MKYSVKKFVEESRVEITFKFTKEEFSAKYEEFLAKEMANAELKGFRKGKVPRAMFLKHFGDYRVREEAANDLINSSYRQALTEKKIDVVEMADIELLDAKDGAFSYVAKVHVYPELVAKDYFGLEVKKDEVKLSKEELEEEINRNLKLHADLEVVEGKPLEVGNTAVFDYTGYVDGVEFEGGKAENYELEIGSGQFIPGFEDQMVGMNAEEEKRIKVKFPENYAEKLAGKDAEFVIKLHEIKNKVLPALDDEFVNELNIEGVKTVKEYKAYLKERMLADKEEAANNKFDNDVFTKVLANNPVCIPDELVKSNVEMRVKEVEKTAKQYGIPTDLLLKYQGIESLDKYRELITPGVKEDIHYEVVVSQIAKQEKVKLDKADFDKYYEEVAKQEKKTVKETKKKYPKDAIKNYFIMKKTHDLIIDSVKK